MLKILTVVFVRWEALYFLFFCIQLGQVWQFHGRGQQVGRWSEIERWGTRKSEKDP